MGSRCGMRGMRCLIRGLWRDQATSNRLRRRDDATGVSYSTANIETVMNLLESTQQFIDAITSDLPAPCPDCYLVVTSCELQHWL